MTAFRYGRLRMVNEWLYLNASVYARKTEDNAKQRYVKGIYGEDKKGGRASTVEAVRAGHLRGSTPAVPIETTPS